MLDGFRWTVDRDTLLVRPRPSCWKCSSRQLQQSFCVTSGLGLNRIKIVGMLASAATHTTVLAIAVVLGRGDRTRAWLIPPEDGVTAIELVARPRSTSTPPATTTITTSAAAPVRRETLQPQRLAVSKRTALRELAPAGNIAVPPVPAAFTENRPPRSAPVVRTDVAERLLLREEALPPRPKRTTSRRDLVLSSPPESSSPSNPSQQLDGTKSKAVPRRNHSPQPRYPPEALAAGVTGRVLLRIRVGVEGRVTAVHVFRSSGVRSLDQAALEAVRRWRFEPATERGRAVASQAIVPVRFRIEP